MKKTVVVTGGAGFIGGHLCRFLLAKGYSVVCIDNMLTGSRSNVADLKSIKRHFSNLKTCKL